MYHILRYHDAAAPARDIEVTAPLISLLELLGAPAAESEVGMAVDQTGDDEGAVGIPRLPIRVLRRQITFRAYPANRLALPDQRGTWDKMNVGLSSLRVAGHECSDALEYRH